MFGKFLAAGNFHLLVHLSVGMNWPVCGQNRESGIYFKSEVVQALSSTYKRMKELTKSTSVSSVKHLCREIEFCGSG